MGKFLNEIFVKTNSYDLWWGIYGLAPLTDWEDIFLFNTAEAATERMGYTCICTRTYLRNSVEELVNDPDEKDFVEHIREYLQDSTIHYHYCFDNLSSDEFFELPYPNLPLNEFGVRPRYIEMWHPNEGIDLQVVEECVREFCLRYLDLQVNQIHFINPVGIDEAVREYTEHIRRFNGPIEVEFTGDLIHNMMTKLSKTKEEVIKILNSSTSK